ncbi:Integral membrane protein SED5 [Coemansia sp. RSA 2603]|nr:Integral membrane protein SED5 [Coemansia sp. RSA 2603]
MVAAKAKTLRDRTNEFRSLTNALRKRQQGATSTSTSDTAKSRPLTNGAYSEFSQHASAIGKDIQDTTLLLERLATLARGKTIFDDRSGEINALTNQVKQRIATLNGKIMSLQALQRKQQQQQGGTSAGGKQANEHHSNIVVSLQSQLASTSTVFKDVLELRSESLKASGNRKEQFIGNAAVVAGNMVFSSTGNVCLRIYRLYTFTIPLLFCILTINHLLLPNVLRIAM